MAPWILDYFCGPSATQMTPLWSWFTEQWQDSIRLFSLSLMKKEFKGVREGKFAFILPSTIGEYISQKAPCDLTTVDRFLLNRGFGLVVEKDSPLLPIINNALHKLMDNGFIDRTYYKWWTKKRDCGGIKSSSIFSANESSKDRCHSLPVIILMSVLVLLSIFA